MKAGAVARLPHIVEPPLADTAMLTPLTDAERSGIHFFPCCAHDSRPAKCERAIRLTVERGKTQWDACYGQTGAIWPVSDQLRATIFLSGLNPNLGAPLRIASLM